MWPKIMLGYIDSAEIWRVVSFNGQSGFSRFGNQLERFVSFISTLMVGFPYGLA